jgi:hypothetical protein
MEHHLARTEERVITIWIAVIAAIAAIGSTVFAGISLRMLSRQTKALSRQVKLQRKQSKAMAIQNNLQHAQYEVVAAATELQFNLDVMVRLQDVLLAVADHEDAHSAIWGVSNDNLRPQMSGDAILDVLSMALKACDRLPHFASNEADWSSYVDHVMGRSSSLRARVLENPEWWPEVVPYAERMEEADAPPISHSVIPEVASDEPPAVPAPGGSS